MSGSGTARNKIIGNYIGVGSDGTTKIGNTNHNIYVWSDANNNTIEQNTIANAAGESHGIFLGCENADFNRITRNSIYDNGGKGICLWDWKPGNEGLAYPWISSATASVVSGTAPANSIVEVFIASISAGSENCGQGKVFVGSTTANGSGYWNLVVGGGYLVSGTSVTATATDINGNTSEFSKNRRVKNIGEAWVNLSNIIDPTFKLNEIYSYPNPAYAKATAGEPVYGAVKIHVECGIADRVYIKFYTLSLEHIGEVTITDRPKVMNNKFAYEYDWDISNVASGIYIYIVDCISEEYKDREIRVIRRMTIIH